MNDLVDRALNTLRFLSADAVQEANSGHPGFPMGAAGLMYTVYMHHMRFSPSHPDWLDRDRFVLSAGHGSALLYSMLALLGVITMDDLRSFRQWGSITPGHPEFGLTPGVEATTGPLGQGFANGVGMAIAEAHLAETYNQPDFEIVDHFTYGIVTDGDLMEGISSEAASLAGHLQLGKLIYLYDDNRITIDGSTDLSFSEDVARRFESYGWEVQRVDDGNDVGAIDEAVARAKSSASPSLIICRTHIGFGSPGLQDTAQVHGSPLGDAELAASKENLGWPVEPRFYVPEDVQVHFREAAQKGNAEKRKWEQSLARYQERFPSLGVDLIRRFKGELPENWEEVLPAAFESKEDISTREASGIALNSLSAVLPELIGGSADLTGSNHAAIHGFPSLARDQMKGRTIHFGVREHAMGAIVNGMSYHGGMRPYCASYLVFTDYLRPAIRIAGLAKLNTIWIMTHDSIFVGQDGPTHQPVEHLMSIRLIPGVRLIRPADAAETTAAWKVAMKSEISPVVLALARQTVPRIDRTRFASADGLARGAYVLADMGDTPPELILMASGSEVELILEAGEVLAAQGYGIRLVSFPCWELFQEQDPAYRREVFPEKVSLRLAVEAGSSLGWDRWVGKEGKVIGVDQFGASAPADILKQKYGLHVEHVIATAQSMLADK